MATIMATSGAKAIGMATATAAAAATVTVTEPTTRTFGQGRVGHADRIIALPPPPDKP